MCVTIFNQVRSIFCSFLAVSHSAGCNPPLCATALDVIPRYLTQGRITFRVVAHSAGWNPNVSDFIPRCRTERRMSFRSIAHSAGCHPVLSHIAQDFIPRCRLQRRISSRVVAHSAEFVLICFPNFALVIVWSSCPVVRCPVRQQLCP